MPRRKDRVKPTQYPFLPFHALRSAQLASAIIVSGIMSYFISQLRHDHYRLPWTFILLLTVSLLTILFLTATIVLHCFYGLNPTLNISLNSVLLVLWSLGFALLTWWTSGTLAHVCNVKNWDNEAGIMICREYKALFAFTLFGVVSTLFALLLDIHVQRKFTHLGKFTALQPPDSKSQHTLPTYAGQAETNPNPTARHASNATARGGMGYVALEEEFKYDPDIGYHGAAGEMERKSLGDR